MIPHEAVGFLISLGIIAITIFAIRKFQKNLLTLNNLFLIFSCVLLLFPLFSISSFELKTGRILKPSTEQKLLEKKVATESEEPDIYYIIFDRYAGPKSLKEEYNIDNSKLYDFLKKNEFYIAEDATTNYPKTFLSLGSSLNFEYLDYLTKKTNGGASPDESIVTPYIRNNKVIKFLKQKGYTFINIGPIWTPTSTNPNADKNYIYREGYPGADEFTTGFLNQTIAAPLFKTLFYDKTAVSKDPENNDHRRRILYELTAIEDASKIQGPKFVFMHILIPHDPFVFDKNCTPISEVVVNKKQHQENYAAQLACANTQIEKMITTILKNSKGTPIIILQSDEGPFPMNVPIPANQAWAKAPTSSLREKFPILNAYLFPGKSDKNLYSSITPVNSFRVLFNTYFGTNYPLLPDKNFVFQDKDNLYKFTEVTERLQEEKTEKN